MPWHAQVGMKEPVRGNDQGVFETEADAWEFLHREAVAGVKLAGHSIRRCQEALLAAQIAAGEAAQEFLEISSLYERWKDRQPK